MSVNSPVEYSLLQAALKKRQQPFVNLTPQEQEVLKWYDSYRANPTPQSDPTGQLIEAEREDEEAGKIGTASATTDAQKAGTYAGKDPNFMRGLEYESGLRASGIRTASKARQDELKRQLGLPVV